jgi:hypothetical protein
VPDRIAVNTSTLPDGDSAKVFMPATGAACASAGTLTTKRTASRAGNGERICHKTTAVMTAPTTAAPPAGKSDDTLARLGDIGRAGGVMTWEGCTTAPGTSVPAPLCVRRSAAIHFSCPRSSAAVCQRSSGCLARQRITADSSVAGSCGLRDVSGGGATCRIAPMIDAWLSPAKGRSPVIIS